MGRRDWVAGDRGRQSVCYGAVPGGGVFALEGSPQRQRPLPRQAAGKEAPPLTESPSTCSSGQRAGGELWQGARPLFSPFFLEGLGPNARWGEGKHRFRAALLVCSAKNPQARAKRPLAAQNPNGVIKLPDKKPGVWRRHPPPYPVGFFPGDLNPTRACGKGALSYFLAGILDHPGASPRAGRCRP